MKETDSNNQKAIRNRYNELGVNEFYKKHGADYTNPHFSYIQSLIENNYHRIDCTRVLDFCCGSGEVSLVLKKLGFSTTQGSDPFTQKAYQKNLRKKCLNYSFEDIIKGELKETYSSVISSFAMHLCEEEQLYPLTHQLLNAAPQLVIITPHKRPLLEKIDGIELIFEDYVLTFKGKKVRLKSYARTY